jgi:hypothetical protein
MTHRTTSALRRSGLVLAGLVFAGLVFAAMASPATADEVVTLPDDTYFVWHPRPGIEPHSSKVAAVGTCGFAILGGHSSRKEPRVEWDVNVDEILHGDDRIVGVSAGTFTVLDRKRVPRPAITAMSFTFEGKEGEVNVEIVGPPNESNAIRGTVPLERAEPLLDALQGDKYVTIAFKYADGSADAVRVRGDRDRDRGSPNAVFTRCLHGNPPHITGPLFRAH